MENESVIQQDQKIIDQAADQWLQIVLANIQHRTNKDKDEKPTTVQN